MCYLRAASHYTTDQIGCDMSRRVTADNRGKWQTSGPLRCTISHYTTDFPRLRIVGGPSQVVVSSKSCSVRNAMPQIQDMAPHPVTVYRHSADLSLCYPLMWNVTLEYTTTHFNVLDKTWSWNPSMTFHTHQRLLNFIMLVWWLSVRSSVDSVPYTPGVEPGTFGVGIYYAFRSPSAASSALWRTWIFSGAGMAQR